MQGESLKSCFQAINSLNIYSEQYEVHNYSDIRKLSNLFKSQLGTEISPLLKRGFPLCLANTLVPETQTQRWELTEKLQTHFQSVWHTQERKQTDRNKTQETNKQRNKITQSEICSHYICFKIASQVLNISKMKGSRNEIRYTYRAKACQKTEKSQ